MKFSIRDLLLVTVIVALLLAWWREHLQAVSARREVLATERLYGEVRDRAVTEAKEHPFLGRGELEDYRLHERPRITSRAGGNA
jgi:hypothetical protein